MIKETTKAKAIILCGVLILWAFGGVAHAAEIKIGYVDMQKALNESEAGKEANVVIESEYVKFQSEGVQRQRELQALQETLQNQGSVLTEEARKEKEREYQNMVKELNRWVEDRRAELKQKDRELTKAALKGLQAVVKKLGEEEKFTIILEKNEAVILYVSNALDLTDRVIHIFNSTTKK